MIQTVINGHWPPFDQSLFDRPDHELTRAGKPREPESGAGRIRAELAKGKSMSSYELAQVLSIGRDKAEALCNGMHRRNVLGHERKESEMTGRTCRHFYLKEKS